MAESHIPNRSKSGTPVIRISHNAAAIALAHTLKGVLQTQEQWEAEISRGGEHASAG
ncbi:hypothetical protein MPNT_60032 [Candidatus Methylacidithermus pantelleriae]|uniref:Uncharacterized protein n=1 Tax=Candidatus Methylacidithermus pantelleriae TaxID=2744239 RepID=A0A8J2BMX8_9BACT|nr:hypothetical protein MPNT_60032 [Candidatus Methylacidithermus pantelleriae]